MSKTAPHQSNQSSYRAPGLKTASTKTLSIAYYEHGPADGWPVVLSHGFPYDIHAFDEAAQMLAQHNARVIVPYTRGFGPTSFLSPDSRRSGQQAARGKDIIELCEALELYKPILGGFDWGGNASCVAAALWPEQIGGLVSYAGYDIIDVTRQLHSFTPALERICWYQHLFQSERGRECLTKDRRDFCRILWREWSPGWSFEEETFLRSAASFDNEDFIDVVIHAYRCMLGLDKGDSALQDLEDRLAKKPLITVPAVTLDGTADPLKPGGTKDHAPFFAGKHDHRTVNTGHNLPQEAPGVFADAILTVHAWLTSS